jgi:hypothetical protein
MSDMPYDIGRSVPSRERDLTLEDAKRLFANLGSAMSDDSLKSVADYEALVQSLLYVISSHDHNRFQVADELLRWRAEVPFDFSNRLQELRTLVEKVAGENNEDMAVIDDLFRSFFEYVRRLHGEIRSAYHPSRYQITYYEAGVPKPLNPLRIVQVLEGQEARINLHISCNGER